MPENKIPHKGAFGMAAEKDFFAGTGPAIPHKPGVPHKPAGGGNVLPPKKPIIPPSAEVSAASILPNASPKRVVLDAPDKQIISENSTKPLEASSEGLAPLRTYRQDVAGVMRDKKTSLVQMVLEEQKERNKRERDTSPTSKKNLPLILLSVFFFFSTAGLIYYIYFHSNPNQTLEDLSIVPLIFSEKNKEIAVDGKEPLKLRDETVASIGDMDLKVDVIEYFFFTETLSVQTPDGVVQKKNLIPANRLFELLGIKMPATLSRSLRPDFMLGVHSFNKNQPFFILKTDYYDSAFAGVLEWESRLAEDLFPLFGRREKVRELSQKKWGDLVIKNKDTRILRNFDGSIALVYMFKDQRTLIITTSEDTLLEVSRRLDLAKEKRPE